VIEDKNTGTGGRSPIVGGGDCFFSEEDPYSKKGKNSRKIFHGSIEAGGSFAGLAEGETALGSRKKQEARVGKMLTMGGSHQ